MLRVHFDNRFINELPGDPEVGTRRREVHGACSPRVLPTLVVAPRRLAYSAEVAEMLDTNAAKLAAPQVAEALAGNRLLPGMDAYAACDGGHQSGQWAGQLGDGRSINLGEVLNRAGQRWELPLTGRRTNILRPPRRRSGGAEQLESRIPLPRVHAPPRRADDELLASLVDFTIARDFPEIAGDAAERRARGVETVCTCTVHKVANWMPVGFVHGGDEHRQHVYPRPDDRLRPLPLDRRL